MVMDMFTGIVGLLALAGIVAGVAITMNDVFEDK